MSTPRDAISRIGQEFYCGACRTWFPTDGASEASADDLWNELNEHQAELQCSGA